MEFRQHFLPGKPLEKNDAQSAGIMLTWAPATNWQSGLDFEWAKSALVEFQDGPTEGSPFLQATRPEGFHYDYDTTQWLLAAWVQWQYDIDEAQGITAGLRAEYIDYDYDNRMLDGNTRDDGTPCGFGGCLYRRPADRSDDFFNLAPELGYRRILDEGLVMRARIARGFRPPQTTELYRLQNEQTVADIDSETLDTAEIGLEGDSERVDWALTAFAMHKRHFIFRDAEGYNVSDGKTRHLGIEGRFDAPLSDHWLLAGNLVWANHEYAFDRLAAAGELIRDGNQVDTAPEWLWSLRLRFLPNERWDSELAWVQTGSYWVDAENAHDYGGHGLLNLRMAWVPGNGRHQFGMRVTNVLDEYYAERGDFAFGNYRYFPGAERRWYFEWTVQAD
jgi:outer membrane receptor protein involved in Fe transport